MRPLIVVVSRRADRNIEAADRWWRDNHATSDAIRDEFSWVVGLLLVNPYMGEIAENARRPGLRYFYLERILHHLYYRVDEQRAHIRLVALRHASRRPVRV